MSNKKSMFENIFCDVTQNSKSTPPDLRVCIYSPIELAKHTLVIVCECIYDPCARKKFCKNGTTWDGL